jgi:phosphatidylinositol kinase/protein kinase (PI-3  family)
MRILSSLQIALVLKLSVLLLSLLCLPAQSRAQDKVELFGGYSSNEVPQPLIARFSPAQSLTPRHKRGSRCDRATSPLAAAFTYP